MFKKSDQVIKTGPDPDAAYAKFSKHGQSKAFIHQLCQELGTLKKLLQLRFVNTCRRTNTSFRFECSGEHFPERERQRERVGRRERERERPIHMQTEIKFPLWRMWKRNLLVLSFGQPQSWVWRTQHYHLKTYQVSPQEQLCRHFSRCLEHIGVVRQLIRNMRTEHEP